MSETTSRDDGAAVGALITPDVLATALAAVSAELRWPTCSGEACGQLVLDADEVVLRQVVAPALVREVQRLVRAATTGQVAAAALVPAPRLAVEQVSAPCDSCCAARATYALAYPDVRRRVCAACLPPDLLVVAEVLDDDDDLALDERSVLERMAP